MPIGNFIRFVALASVALAGSVATAEAACQPSQKYPDWVQGQKLCLAMQVHGTETANPALVVLLHGDVSSGGPADYLYRAARQLGGSGVIAVALLRPGYGDKAGKTSEGTNHGRRDSYSRTNIAAVGAAIEALKAHYKPRSVIIVGHSGGAAIAGVLIGQKPGIADAAVLVSCPCNIPRWRRERDRGPWRRSLSPHTFAATVSPKTTVVAITGDDDDNTSPRLARDYIATLVKRGVPARFQQVAGTHSYRHLAGPTAAVVTSLLTR